MTLTELRYIVALAKERHFGKAAKTCFVSQPTLSVAINKLEANLGISIFERSHSDVHLTDVGKQIIAQAQSVLIEAKKIEEIVAANKSQLTTPLKIGAIYTVAPYLLPLLVPKLKQLAPDMPLIIQEDFTTNLQDKLQQGELDAIFIALPFSVKGIVSKALYREPFVVLMRKDHPLSHVDAISKQDLAKEDILLLGEGHCFRDNVIMACPSCYQPNNPQQTIAGTSLETLRHMVVSGMGITILPSSATQIQHYADYVCTKSFTDKTPSRDVALAWRVSYPRNKAIDVLTQAITECNLESVGDISLLI